MLPQNGGPSRWRLPLTSMLIFMLMIHAFKWKPMPTKMPMSPMKWNGLQTIRNSAWALSIDWAKRVHDQEQSPSHTHFRGDCKECLSCDTNVAVKLPRYHKSLRCRIICQRFEGRMISTDLIIHLTILKIKRKEDLKEDLHWIQSHQHGAKDRTNSRGQIHQVDGTIGGRWSCWVTVFLQC